MANIPQLDSSGGKRSLTAEVNLVPFIDLLSTTICFLLMTAVWIQTSSLPIRQAEGDTAILPAPGDTMTLKFRGPTTLDIEVKVKGQVKSSARLEGKTSDELFEGLNHTLQTLFPSDAPSRVNRTGGVSAFVFPDERVSYGKLVRVLDCLRQHGIVNLGVLPKAG